MFTFNRSYAVLALALLLLEIFIGRYVHDRFIRPYIGDLLVVILLYCMVKTIVNSRIISTALGVLLLAFLIEGLQYFHWADALGFQRGSIMYILAGNSFSWMDMLMYTIGCTIIVIAEYIKKY